MPATALTDKSIERLNKAASGKRVEKFDRLQPGLALRITDKGVKSWCVYYRHDGRNQRMTLGRWPGVKVADARKEARKVRDQAEAGVNPKAAKDIEATKAKAELEAEAERLQTFGAIAEKYLSREVPKLKRGDDVAYILRERLIPAWGDKPAIQLRKRHVVDLIDSLLDQDKPGAANQTFKAVRRLYRWAHARDDIEFNPIAGMEPPITAGVRARVLSHAEMRVLWAAWDRIGYPWGPLQKLLLLTGQRRAEVGGMRWRELDDPDNPTVWTIPAERSKNRRAHRVPLSRPARALLADLPRLSGGDYVFSTRGGRTPVSGWSKGKARTDNFAARVASDMDTEAPQDWSLHDLRRSARTELARLQVPEVVAERVLNHARQGLAAVYDQYAYDREKAEALERWAGELLRIVEGRETASNVVTMEAVR